MYSSLCPGFLRNPIFLLTQSLLSFLSPFPSWPWRLTSWPLQIYPFLSISLSYLFLCCSGTVHAFRTISLSIILSHILKFGAHCPCVACLWAVYTKLYCLVFQLFAVVESSVLKIFIAWYFLFFSWRERSKDSKCLFACLVFVIMMNSFNFMWLKSPISFFGTFFLKCWFLFIF